MGLTPNFMDMDMDTMNVDLDDLEARITNNTRACPWCTSSVMCATWIGSSRFVPSTNYFAPVVQVQHRSIPENFSVKSYVIKHVTALD